MKICQRGYRAPTQSAQSQSCVKKSVFCALALLLLPACRREARNENPTTPPAVAVAAPTTVSTNDHAEVFRRAFWRQPTAADRILHAERRVQPAPAGGSMSGESWRWFIQLHPSSSLLAALRDPETFGLLPLSRDAVPRLWQAAPAWFPSPDSPEIAGLEMLQTPASGPTILYDAGENLLFATDSGRGFTAPAR